MSAHLQIETCSWTLDQCWLDLATDAINDLCKIWWDSQGSLHDGHSQIN